MAPQGPIQTPVERAAPLPQVPDQSGLQAGPVVTGQMLAVAAEEEVRPIQVQQVVRAVRV